MIPPPCPRCWEREREGEGERVGGQAEGVSMLAERNQTEPDNGGKHPSDCRKKIGFPEA